MPTQPGLAGAHLLQTDSPSLAPTTEQRIRKLADRAGDWIFVATGYDAQALHRVGEGVLSTASLQSAGAAEGVIPASYTFRLSLTAAEAR